MPFLDRLARVYRGLDIACLECYLVDDCTGGEDVKVVLLCESPHTEEVLSRPRRPLVGNSGKGVAKVLRELVLRVPNTGGAIGDLVCERTEGFGWLGLMNACPLPMQKKVYSAALQQSHAGLFNDLQRLREGLPPVRRGLADAVREDLQCRWNRVVARVDGGALLIPCGEVARRLCDLAQIRNENLPNTPHPSRNQWTRALELYRTIERIREALGRQQPEGAGGAAWRTRTGRAPGTAGPGTR